MMWLLYLTACSQTPGTPEGGSIETEWSSLQLVADDAVASVDLVAPERDPHLCDTDETTRPAPLTGLVVELGCPDDSPLWTEQVALPIEGDVLATVPRAEAYDIAFEMDGGCEPAYGEGTLWQPVVARVAARFGPTENDDPSSIGTVSCSGDACVVVESEDTLHVCRSPVAAACGSFASCLAPPATILLDPPSEDDAGWVLRAWVDGGASGTVRFSLDDEGGQTWTVPATIEASQAEATVTQELLESLDDNDDGAVSVVASFRDACGRSLDSEIELLTW